MACYRMKPYLYLYLIHTLIAIVTGEIHRVFSISIKFVNFSFLNLFS